MVQRGRYSVVSDKGVTVVLDTQLTPTLIEEGNVRELISKWQNMRREADYNVADYIVAGYVGDTLLYDTISRNNDVIAGEILANTLTYGNPPANAYEKEWNVNGEQIRLWVAKV